MQGGDLSNFSYGTILVHVDCLLKEVSLPPKFFGGMRKPKIVKRLDPLKANALYRTGMSILPNMECFSTDGDEHGLSQWEKELGDWGLDVFKRYHVHPTVDSVVHDLPFRPNVIGVVDVPERALRYGSYFVEFASLVRN